MGIKRQTWHIMNKYTIPKDILVKRFSTETLNRFGSLARFEGWCRFVLTSKECCVDGKFFGVVFGWMLSVNIASSSTILELYSLLFFPILRIWNFSHFSRSTAGTFASLDWRGIESFSLPILWSLEDVVICIMSPLESWLLVMYTSESVTKNECRCYVRSKYLIWYDLHQKVSCRYSLQIVDIIQVKFQFLSLESFHS